MGVTADHHEPNPDHGGLATRLRVYRMRAGLSQEELAERSGLSVRSIGNLERGHVRWPFHGTVDRLADALGLNGSARADFVAAAHRRPAVRSANGHQAGVAT